MRVFLNRWQAVSAADVLGSVFIAQRVLLESLRKQVLAGSGLTPEVAEILVELFLAGGVLSSAEHSDAEGFVSFRELRSGLGYSAGLLSRRIGFICQRGWAETARIEAGIASGLHGNSQKVRITEFGKAKVGPVWRRYDELAQRLLAGIPPEDLGVHYRINELIHDKLQGPPQIPEAEDYSEAPPMKPAPRKAKVVSIPPAEAAPKSPSTQAEPEFLD